MTVERTMENAFAAGLYAHTRGVPATSNPHTDYYCGVAWSLGWHWANGWRPVERPVIEASDLDVMRVSLGLSVADLEKLAA